MKTIKKITTLVLSLVFVGALLLEPMNSLKVEAATYVTLASATISGSNVNVSGSGYMATDDGQYHIYAQSAYMTGATGTEVATTAAAANFSATFPLNLNSTSSMLSKKFTVVGKVGGQLVQLSNCMYITNPEAVAKHTVARMDNGKKGLLASLDGKFMYQNNVSTLGAKQVLLNIPLSRLSNGGSYTYNGQTYPFNTTYLAGFDAAVRHWNAQGAQVTAVILVDKGSNANFVNPLSNIGKKPSNNEYMALNAHNEAGCQYLAALGAFLGEHYSNIGCGQVDNFIIGNEVNAAPQWNYMKVSSFTEYMVEYTNAFRVLYNGIKSANANANVYICTDNEWAKPSASYFYAGKDFIATFNTLCKAEGNIDWRLATHAFDVPLTTTKIWRSNSQLTHSQSSPFISIQNIEVVTDFLCQTDLLSPTGAVRTVKLSEQGYSSHNGEQAQAAAVEFALLTTDANSHIDGIILSREEDVQYEISQGLKLGLMDTKGNKKLAWNFFQNYTDPYYINLANQYAGTNLVAMIQRR